VERLKHMPGVKEQIEQFRTGFKNVSEEYIRVSLVGVGGVELHKSPKYVFLS
jgi:hypothetical protein